MKARKHGSPPAPASRPVAFLWSWLSEEQQHAAMASALRSPLATVRARASASQNTPGDYVWLRFGADVWMVVAGISADDLRSEVSVAGAGERAP